MKNKLYTAIGLMSGTSMDGVDLSLIRSDGVSKFTSILNNYFEFNQELQSKLMNLRDKIFNLKDLDKYSEEMAILEREITLFHSKMIDKVLRTTSHNIDLI